MMLHIRDMLSEFGGHGCRIVFRMHITGDDLMLCLEQFLEAHHRLAQRLNCSDILHITDIGRGIKQVITPDTECIL